MARDSSGNFSLVGSAFVTGQTASATEVNAKLNDIATELTDSLSRSGKGGLTQPLRLPDGSVSGPGLAFTQETGSGWYRAGAGDVRLAVQGSDVLKVTASSGLWNRAIATDDTSTTLDTGADIAGLSFACASGKRYIVRAVMWAYAAATTTGIGYSAKATGAPTTSVVRTAQHHWPSIDGHHTRFYNAFLDQPTAFFDTAASSLSIPQADHLDFYFVTTGTGTFQLRVATEVSGSAVTVASGSYVEWLEV